MSISFAKLGEGECKTCEAYIYKLHIHETEGKEPLSTPDNNKCKEKNYPHPIETCKKYKEWSTHMVRAGITQEFYRADKRRQVDVTEPINAEVLEKVIMLPRSDTKDCLYISTKPSHQLVVMLIHSVFSGIKVSVGETTKIHQVFVLIKMWKPFLPSLPLYRTEYYLDFVWSFSS